MTAQHWHIRYNPGTPDEVDYPRHFPTMSDALNCSKMLFHPVPDVPNQSAPLVAEEVPGCGCLPFEPPTHCDTPGCGNALDWHPGEPYLCAGCQDALIVLCPDVCAICGADIQDGYVIQWRPSGPVKICFTDDGPNLCGLQSEFADSAAEFTELGLRPVAVTEEEGWQRDLDNAIRDYEETASALCDDGPGSERFRRDIRRAHLEAAAQLVKIGREPPPASAYPSACWGCGERPVMAPDDWHAPWCGAMCCESAGTNYAPEMD